MLVGMLMNALQGLVADQAQSLMKEHVVDKISEHLNDDAKRELDQHIEKMTDNAQVIKGHVWLIHLNKEVNKLGTLTIHL